MLHMNTTSFSRRRELSRRPVPRPAGPGDGPGRSTPPAHCYDTANPWNNMAGHLIWLGAAEIEAYGVKSGRDPNQALAAIAALNKAGEAYEEREAAAAHELETTFDFIRLKDGTSAGVERRRYN